MKRFLKCSIILCFSVFLCSCAKKVEKVTFTELFEMDSKKIIYKLPENHISSTFVDQGKDCAIYVYYHPNYDKEFDLDENKLKKMGKKEINGIEYEWFKKDGTSKFKCITEKGGYYSIYYDCEKGYDDDEQVEEFMKTVQFMD